MSDDLTEPHMRQEDGPVVMLGRSDRQLLLAKITVGDLPRSFRFYTEIAGLRMATLEGLSPPPPGESDPEVDFCEVPLNYSGSLADPFFVLVKRRGVTPSADHARLTVIGFKVPDPLAIVERAERAGFAGGRRDVDLGAMAFSFVEDPDGYTLELIKAPSFAI